MDDALRLRWTRLNQTTLLLKIGSLTTARFRLRGKKWTGALLESKRPFDKIEMQRTLVKPIERVLNGALIFHGALLFKAKRAHIVIAPSGTGKSTLTAYLAQNGWSALTDDMSLLFIKNQRVYARGIRPSIALTRVSMRMLKISGSTRSKSKTKFALRSARTKVVNIQSIIFLKRSKRWSASPLEKLEAMNELIHNTWRPQLAMDSSFPRFLSDIAKLVERVPCEVIEYPKLKASLARTRKHLEGKRPKGVKNGTSSSRSRTGSRK